MRKCLLKSTHMYMHVLTKLPVQPPFLVLYRATYMVDTNTQKKEGIGTFVLVLLLNIQHATISLVNIHRLITYTYNITTISMGIIATMFAVDLTVKHSPTFPG